MCAEDAEERKTQGHRRVVNDGLLAQEVCQRSFPPSPPPLICVISPSINLLSVTMSVIETPPLKALISAQLRLRGVRADWPEPKEDDDDDGDSGGLGVDWLKWVRSGAEWACE